MWKFESSNLTLSIALQTFLLLLACTIFDCGSVKLDQARTNCIGAANENGKCIIEAIFGRIKSSSNDEMVDVLINCTNFSSIKLDSVKQFASIERVVWNGCRAEHQLTGFGLGLLMRQSQVKFMRIEQFTMDDVGAGIFENFSSLENLEMVNNSIDTLSAECFRGMKALKVLILTGNNLRKIARGILSDLPKLSTLRIHDEDQKRGVFIDSPQLANLKVVNEVSLIINDLIPIHPNFLEHLLSHTQNFSLIIKTTKREEIERECQQTILNGFGKDWIVESLKLENFSCGFVMSDVESIKSLELNGILSHPFPGTIRLKRLTNLEQLSMHRNNFENSTIREILVDDEKFAKLKMLNLSNNYKMHDFDMQIVERCEEMNKIDLIGNELKSLEHFQDVTSNAIVEVFVDGNALICSWLNDKIPKASPRLNLVFVSNFQGLNFRGLPCTLDEEHEKLQLPAPEAITKVSLSPTIENQIEKINSIAVMSIIFTCSLTLGVALTLVTLQIYHRYFVRRQEPFYHLLRDSLPLPAVTHARRRARLSDGHIDNNLSSRELPATNYEHPIFDSETDLMSDGDITDMSTINIYEEIPVNRSN